MIRHASGLTFAALLLASAAPGLAQNSSAPATPPKGTAPSTTPPASPPSPPPASETPAAETPVVTTPPVVVVPAPAPAPAPAPIELPADVPYPNGFADPTAPYGNDMSVTVRESESFWDWGMLGLLGLFGLLGLRGRNGGYRQIIRDERYEEDRFRRDGPR